MKTNLEIVAGLILFFTVAACATAQPEPVIAMKSPVQLGKWIVQLGDGDYDRRKEALQLLGDHANAALPLLKEKLRQEGDSNLAWWLRAAIQECEQDLDHPGDISATPGDSDGLTVNDKCPGDGLFSIIERDGVDCWEVSRPGYLYFVVGDDFRRQGAGAVEIELDVLDTKSGNIMLEYDSRDSKATLDGAYKTNPLVVRRENTGQWQRIHFRITDARFRGSENGGSDFRFNNDGDDMIIRAVHVRRLSR
jgi:hypothetical protein